MAGIPVSLSKLVEQTFLSGFASDARILSNNPVNYNSTAPSTGNLGWFIQLPESGERVIVEPFQLAQQGLLYFNTMTPSTSPCSAGGSSWLMAVLKKTGGNPDINANALDYNKDQTLDGDDKVSDSSNQEAYVAGVKFGFGIASSTSVIKNNAGKTFGYTSGTNSLKPIKSVLPGGTATGKRMSWKQLL